MKNTFQNYPKDFYYLWDGVFEHQKKKLDCIKALMAFEYFLSRRFFF